MTLYDYFKGWTKVIDINELNRVTRIIGNIQKPICPSFPEVFKAFTLCSYENLKVVMLGKDPYPQKNVATGILFGNKEGTKLSPSLEIVKETCLNFEVPHNSIIFDPTLESWAKQGVLMINSALTVEMNKVGSHTMLWRPFITKLLKNLSEWNTGIIYVLFGEQARTFKPYINSRFNVILEEKHPSYYDRENKRMPSKVFKDISKLTKEKYGNPIEWFQEY